MLRWLTAGESHGEAVLGVLEGLPAGVQITTQEVADALARNGLKVTKKREKNGWAALEAVLA